jgi:hypothetical protein
MSELGQVLPDETRFSQDSCIIDSGRDVHLGHGTRASAARPYVGSSETDVVSVR